MSLISKTRLNECTLQSKQTTLQPPLGVFAYEFITCHTYDLFYLFIAYHRMIPDRSWKLAQHLHLSLTQSSSSLQLHMPQSHPMYMVFAPISPSFILKPSTFIFALLHVIYHLFIIVYLFSFLLLILLIMATFHLLTHSSSWHEHLQCRSQFIPAHVVHLRFIFLPLEQFC